MGPKGLEPEKKRGRWCWRPEGRSCGSRATRREGGMKKDVMMRKMPRIVFSYIKHMLKI
jgi:hypothetical protein